MQLPNEVKRPEGVLGEWLCWSGAYAHEPPHYRDMNRTVRMHGEQIHIHLIAQPFRNNLLHICWKKKEQTREKPTDTAIVP